MPVAYTAPNQQNDECDCEEAASNDSSDQPSDIYRRGRVVVIVAGVVRDVGALSEAITA